MAKALWVLIAAAGKPDLLGRTLESLAAAKKPASYRGTLVVENGPRCGIEEVVSRFSREHSFRHLYVAEANKSHALNCGLTRLDRGLVFMTDDDVRLDKHVLVEYDEAAKGREAGEFYGGAVQIDAEHGLPPEWMRRFYPLTIAEPWSLPYSQRTVVTKKQNFMGTNWAAFADDLVAAGGFDTRLGPGGTTGSAGQETEAQRRLVAGGAAAVYVPEAIAWHYLHREFLEPEWVLRRAYRHSLEWGIRRTRDGQPSIAPLVRATIGRINAAAKSMLLRLLGGERRRFEAALHEARWRGRWDGIWLGLRWEEVRQVEKPEKRGGVARAA